MCWSRAAYLVCELAPLPTPAAADVSETGSNVMTGLVQRFDAFQKERVLAFEFLADASYRRRGNDQSAHRLVRFDPRSRERHVVANGVA
jgi:hypothetical protein